MTLAYSPDALIFDADTRAYALRPDFDPSVHRVDIETVAALGWQAGSEDGWNAPDDPPIAHVRDMFGVPIHAGHAYAADRFELTAPGGGRIRVDVIEIDHDPVGFLTGTPLDADMDYPVAHREDNVKREYVATGFGPGTVVATRQGDLPVEWLAAGDAILTADGLFRPLRWIGHTRVSAHDPECEKGLRPVCLHQGSAGLGAPRDTLWLASDAQVLVTGPEVAPHFGFDRMLARAGEMWDASASRNNAAGMTYFMLLFDRHEVVCANGAWCGSLFVDIKTGADLRRQFATFPAGISHHRYALPCLERWEAEFMRAGRIAPAEQVQIAAA